MKKFLPVIASSPLFAGIAPQDLEAMLGCLDARSAQFSKGEYLMHAGTPTASLGLVLTGRVLILKEDFWGGRNLLSAPGPGQCFAEAFAAVPGAPLTVSVCADTACTVLFLQVQRVLTLCPQSCGHHSQLVQNLLSDLAAKNLSLTEKLSHLGKRTTRSKLLSYLSAEAQRQNSTVFDIPFTRQQLADYLLVERSGLSAELSKMRKEGLLDMDKNHFHLYDPPLSK